MYFQAYEHAFRVVLWDPNGLYMEVKAKPQLCRDGMVRLKLPADFSLSYFKSLEVVHTLHTGLIDRSKRIDFFAPYNQFEKFCTRSFFVGLRSLDVSPNKARISIPSVKPFFVVEDMIPFLNLHISWQSEHDGSGIKMLKEDSCISREGNDATLVTVGEASRPVWQLGHDAILSSAIQFLWIPCRHAC